MMKALFAALTLLVALSGPVRAETTIVFATDATWPPMEMVNDQKQVVGYSIDYMTAAGKEAGFTPGVQEHRLGRHLRRPVRQQV